jgi:hypothetical protein
VSYRPITDVWILARPKVRYYGAYPSGFLERARALLGVTLADSVLHVCGGRVRDYPFRGLGPNDKTLDLDEQLAPDFVLDLTTVKALPNPRWAAILADPPYTEADADEYSHGRKYLPNANELLALCLSGVRAGGRVGMLHYLWPRPPKTARSVAVVGVLVGFSNRIRCFSVFERA